MGERYTRLFSLSEQLYIENAPVIIAAGALLKDNKTDNVLVQLKFQNIEEKQIKALTVQIIPLDIKNKKIGEKIEYQYLDLNEERDVYFGADVPIIVSNNNVRGFEVGVTEVIFKDNTEWEHEYISWGILEKPHLLKDTLKSCISCIYNNCSLVEVDCNRRFHGSLPLSFGFYFGLIANCSAKAN